MIVCLRGLAEFIILSYLFWANKRKCFISPLLNQHEFFFPPRTILTRKFYAQENIFHKFFMIQHWESSTRNFWCSNNGKKCWITRSITFLASLRSLSNILLNLLSANAPIKVLCLKRKSDAKIKSLISFCRLPFWWETAFYSLLSVRHRI